MFIILMIKAVKICVKWLLCNEVIYLYFKLAYTS